MHDFRTRKKFDAVEIHHDVVRIIFPSRCAGKQSVFPQMFSAVVQGIPDGRDEGSEPEVIRGLDCNSFNHGAEPVAIMPIPDLSPDWLDTVTRPRST